MGGRSSESSAQKNERLAAEALANEQNQIATKEKETMLKSEADEKLKAAQLAKRGRGMQGGGREGLMYQGSNVGVAK